MNYRRRHMFPYTRILAILLSVGLVCSFGLHSLQIEHTHFTPHQIHTHAGGEDHEHESGKSMLGEYMHSSDKKLFDVLFLGSVFLLGFLDPLLMVWKHLLSSALRRVVSVIENYASRYRMYDYLHVYFKRGILHTKAH